MQSIIDLIKPGFKVEFTQKNMPQESLLNQECKEEIQLDQEVIIWIEKLTYAVS